MACRWLSARLKGNDVCDAIFVALQVSYGGFHRPALDPSSVGQKSVRTASFCIPPYLYDAHMERFDSTGAFIGALRRADEEGVPLLLNVGMPWAARQYSPQMWSLFTNRELFEEPVRLRGFEPSLDRLVAKYKRHSAENFDFTAYRNEER